MAREFFNAYHSYLKAVEPLNDAECGRLFVACLQYSMSGAEPELRGNERFVFPSIRQQIDRDVERYAQKCETNRRNGALGGQANAPERYRTLPNAPRSLPKEKEKEKEKTKERAKDEGKARFTPPTLSDVTAYCKERKNDVDPQKFFDFFDAGNWVDSKGEPVKNWKQKVITWEGRTRASPQNKNGNVFLDMLEENA